MNFNRRNILILLASAAIGLILGLLVSTSDAGADELWIKTRAALEVTGVAAVTGASPAPAPTPEPIPACPLDGTAYTAGTCTLDPTVMPASPEITERRVCAARNFETYADFPCEMDTTWTCETTHYSTCHPTVTEPEVGDG